MSPRRVLIRVLPCVLGAVALSGCGMIESDPHRFERWGQAVAAIPVAAEAGPEVRDGPQAARPPLRVEVLDVDTFWAAREGELGAGLREAARVAGPVLAAAAGERVIPAVAPAHQPAPRPAGRALVQLGAYSSEQAALAAWREIRRRGGAPLAALDPVLEPVERDGRPLVRLKAGPVDPAAAEAVCLAAGVADRWCASTGRS